MQQKTGQQFVVTKHYNLGDFDACILVSNFAGTPIQFTTDSQEGENIWIYGYPQRVSVVGQGAAKGLVNTDRGKSLLLAVFCAPGSSGGPVMNAKGQLVGLGSFPAMATSKAGIQEGVRTRLHRGFSLSAGWPCRFFGGRPPTEQRL